MHELDESLSERSHVSLLATLCPLLGGPGIGLALGTGSGDVANLEREAEELSVGRTITGAYSDTRPSSFNIEAIPVCPIFFLDPFY